jgi:hypothetical protein
MWLLNQIAEARITEAMARGEFDNLPGSGRPLSLDDDRLVPKSLRAGFRILKNAGYLPPELEIRQEIRRIEQLLAIIEEGPERREAGKRLNYLLGTLEATQSPTAGRLQVEQYYYEKLIQRLERKMNNE